MVNMLIRRISMPYSRNVEVGHDPLDRDRAIDPACGRARLVFVGWSEEVFLRFAKPGKPTTRFSGLRYDLWGGEGGRV